METKSRGVIYYRVSTEDQAQFGVSLDQQKKHCQAFADSNGIKIVRLFHDDGVSAKTTEREGLQELIKFCTLKNNNVDCVIVYKIDRLTRNVNDYTNILMLLNKLGIRLISTTEAIDSSPIGKFIGNVMAANAQLDNDIKSQRVSACMLEKIEQGNWCWKASIGYRNDRNEINKKVIILDNKRADFIKWIFDEYSKGLYTLEEIRKKVNEKGFRTWKGKEISFQFISKIITNKFYIGIMTVKGKDYQGNHEKLIDHDVFYKCQSILKGNSRGESISRNQASEFFPLRHFAICGFCGRPLTGYVSKGRWGGKFPYYRCYNKLCNSKRSLAKKEVEENFSNYLKSIVPKDKFTKSFKAVVLDVWEEEYKRLNEDFKVKVKRIEDLKEEKIKLIEMKKRDLLPDEDFKEAFDKVRTEIENKEIDLSSTKLEEFNIDEAVDCVFDFIKTIPEYWEKATFEQKLRLQGLIFHEKPIYDYKTFHTPKLSPILQIKEELAHANSSIVDYCIENLHPLVLDIKKWAIGIKVLTQTSF